MKSEEQTDRLLAYCAGRLDAATAGELERHIESCCQCAAFRDSQFSVWSALDQWEAVPVSADFNRRLYARIEAAGANPWYRRWLDVLRPVLARPALSLTAAAAIVVAGFVLDHPAAAPRISRVPAVKTANIPVSATDAEQVEKTLDDLEMLRQFDVQNPDDKQQTSKSM